ncbi:MAG TPA: tripartite tricarboxylate transporter substrate binding protein [Burkholderiales bacterium]|nr:tripartite tricarboxylate transporter substrate binding protein [Burkholderiales bacterium]
MPAILRSSRIVLLVAAAILPVSTSAQQWPSKPVRIVIPWAPGGSTDIVGRLLAADMTQRLKQQVIIDNRPGGGSIPGLHLAAAMPPDGYNFMMTSTAYGHLINPKLAKGIDYAKSFDPVALIGFGDSVLCVHPTLPVNSVKELIALAKKRPGELNYSSSGIGGFPHMNTELFKLMTGTNIVHVPFTGGGPAAADTMAGNTQINLGSVPSLIGYIRSGRLKPLGTGGKKRNAQLPNVPTMTEAGVPGYVTYIWWAIFAPLKTSPETIKSMHGAIMTSLEGRDMQQKLEAQGVEIQKATPADLGKLMVDETNRWQDVIRRAGIKGE